MISAIYDRRSIRKFLDKPISQKDIADIIQSGLKAPSSKNRQPWRYIVIQGNAKEEMLKVFRQGIEREENVSALLPQSRQYIASAKYTVDIMAKVPTIIFVVNSLGKSIMEELCKWLNSNGQLIAAIAFGYPDEFPDERPRKKIEDIVEWRNLH